MQKFKWFLLLAVSVLLVSCVPAKMQQSPKEKSREKTTATETDKLAENVLSEKVSGEVITIQTPEKWSELKSDKGNGIPSIKLGLDKSFEKSGILVQIFPKTFQSVIDVRKKYEELNTYGGFAEAVMINGFPTKQTISQKYIQMGEGSNQEASAMIKMMETPNNYLIVVGRTFDTSETSWNTLKKAVDSVSVDDKQTDSRGKILQDKKPKTLKKLGNPVDNLQLDKKNKNDKITGKEEGDKIEADLGGAKSSIVELSYDREQMLITIALKDDSFKKVIKDIYEGKELNKNYANWHIQTYWHFTALTERLDREYHVKGHRLIVINPYNEKQVLFYAEEGKVKYDAMEDFIRVR